MYAIGNTNFLEIIKNENNAYPEREITNLIFHEKTIYNTLYSTERCFKREQ